MNKGPRGRNQPRQRTLADALRRFAAKCVHDPVTGCVLWIGGKTRGRGKTAYYGSFKYEGKRWYAHRWAAKFIMGLEIENLDVDHKCCNTLCQFHLQAVTKDVNGAYYWLRIEKGILDLPPPDEVDEDGVPYYLPPIWFKIFSKPVGVEVIPDLTTEDVFVG